jgi:hypothetical protein
MISRILTLAKLESGAEEYDRRRIDLTELVRDIAADADFEAKGKNKFVEVSVEKKIAVIGSENLLRSAIENVLRNAVRYTADRTVVGVDLRSENGSAVIEVTDHGGGVPEDQLELLFRPFYRIGTDRTRKTGGTGLGLAIADRAIKAHKGSITATNHNGGLRVEIKLKADINERIPRTINRRQISAVARVDRSAAVVPTDPLEIRRPAVAASPRNATTRAPCIKCFRMPSFRCPTNPKIARMTPIADGMSAVGLPAPMETP